jgi:hypothetical protein
VRLFSLLSFLASLIYSYCVGLLLVPALGARSVKIGEYTAGRNGLLSEYVRRQTGTVLGRSKVAAYLRRAKNKTKSFSRAPSLPPLSLCYVCLSPFLALAGLAALNGAKVDPDSLIGKDWSSTLGPDHFPSVKHKLSAGGNPALKDSYNSQKKLGAKPVKREYKKKRPRATLASSSELLQPTSQTTDPLLLPHSLSLPHPPPLPSTSSSFSPSDLATFLSSFTPIHSFTASSRALHVAGLSSLDTVTACIVSKAPMVEAAVEALVQGGKVEENEGKWVVYAFEMARRQRRTEEGS